MQLQFAKFVNWVIRQKAKKFVTEYRDNLRVVVEANLQKEVTGSIISRTKLHSEQPVSICAIWNKERAKIGTTQWAYRTATNELYLPKYKS